MAGRHRILGKLRHELADGFFGIETDFGRVRPDERATENAARQAREIVPLERLERADGNLRNVGNLTQRRAAALSRLAQRTSTIAGGSLGSHGWGPRLC